MKSKFLLAAGLLATAFGYSQTNSYYAPTGSAGSYGDKCVFLGVSAGYSTTGGENNVFVGFNSAQANIDGNGNVFMGYKTGQSLVYGQNNVFLGNGAARNVVVIDSIRNSDGDSSIENNVFVGSFAGGNNSAWSNTFVGTYSGGSSVGKSNCYFGSNSGKYASGVNNVLVGANAGENVVGDRNTILGTEAGDGGADSLNVGNRNVFIGFRSGQYETGDDKLYIANTGTSNPLIYGEFTNDSLQPLIKFNAYKVGIGYEGTTDPGFGSFPTSYDTSTLKYRFFVRGGILAEEVRIRLQSTWADYVFAEEYNLMPLNEVEEYIAKEGHLPNMPSAKAVEEEGLALGEIVKLQQEKIEELTLHLIEQQKEMEAIKSQLQELTNKK